MSVVIPFPAPRDVAPTPATVSLVAPFEFEEADEAVLARVKVVPDEGRTYFWSVETLAEVVARLIIRGEDGDAEAGDLAGFLLFTTMDLAGADAGVGG
jgi:hypothetical protein